MGFFKKSSYYYTQKIGKFVRFYAVLKIKIQSSKYSAGTVKKDPPADMLVNITSANTGQAVSVNTVAIMTVFTIRL